MGNYQKLQKYIEVNHSDFEVIYSHDSAIERYKYLERGLDARPIMVFKPISQEQLQKIIQLLNQFDCAAVIFAGNTGLVSAQRAYDSAVIDINHLNNLISLELKSGDVYEFSQFDSKTSPAKKAQLWQENLIRWQQHNNYSREDFRGAVLSVQAATPVGSINYVLEPAGLELPIDMGSVAFAGGMTIGGGVANASHGTYGIMHGKASDLVIEANSINGDGTLRADIGVVADKNFKVKIDNSKTQINSAKAQYGDSAIGTQGTFAVITNIKLKTTLIPLQQHYFLMRLNSIHEVLKVRDNLHDKFPENLREFEIMNCFSVGLVREFEKDNFINPFYGEDGHPVGNSSKIDSKYIVLAEFVSDNSEDNIGINAYEFFGEELGFAEVNLAYAAAGAGNPERLKNLRHSISGASTKYANSIADDGHVSHRITPDVSVPLDDVVEYIADIEDYCEGQNFKVAIFGHINIGAFHIHIFTPEDVDLSSEIEVAEAIKGDCSSQASSSQTSDFQNIVAAPTFKAKSILTEDASKRSTGIYDNSVEEQGEGESPLSDKKEPPSSVLFSFPSHPSGEDVSSPLRDNSSSDEDASKQKTTLKQKITEDIFTITKKYDGSCWSEHGIGTANAALYKKYTPEEDVAQWLSYKKKYDPKNVLSPKSNGF